MGSKIAIIILCTAIFIPLVLGFCSFHKIKEQQQQKNHEGIQESTEILIIIKVILVH